MEPFLGAIKLFSFGWTPSSYALCNGQSIPIAQNVALYALLSNTFGGDGLANFALPDLRSRIPIGTDAVSNIKQGSYGGKDYVTLSINEMAGHTHKFYATSQEANAYFMDKNNDDILAFAAGSPGGKPAQPVYGPPPTSTSVVPLSPLTGSWVGGNQPHSNIQPTMVVNFCIALEGYFPPRP